jgi:hypothetical protein
VGSQLGSVATNPAGAAVGIRNVWGYDHQGHWVDLDSR